jgi:hypothetical protein
MQYLLSVDMIFEQGNPAGIKQVFDSLGSSFVALAISSGGRLTK